MADAAGILCPICGEYKHKLLTANFPVCLHSCCSVCMVKYIEICIGDGRKPKCPCNCNTEMTTIEQLQAFVPELVPVFKNMLDLEAIPAGQRFYCQHCSLLMNLSFSRPASDALQCFFPKLHCPSCEGVSCQSCVSKWHESLSCTQFKSSLPSPIQDSIPMSRCPNCRHGVQLASGCIEITCHCGFQFCYTCEAPIFNRRRRCDCSFTIVGDPELLGDPENENGDVDVGEEDAQDVFFFDEDWLNY